MRIIRLADKKEWMIKQGWPIEYIDFALSIDNKFSPWIVREILKLQKNLRARYDHKLDKNSKEERYTVLTAFRVLHPNAQLRSILDWVNSQTPDLYSYNIDQAVKLTEEWHESLKNQEPVATYFTHDVWYTFSDGWSIVRLTEHDLEAEGEHMGHCVGEGSYHKDVSSGYVYIFSLRDTKNKPHATIEANYSKRNGKDSFIIVQIQGKANQEPIQIYKEKIKEWILSFNENENTTIFGDIDEINDMYGSSIKEYLSNTHHIDPEYGYIMYSDELDNILVVFVRIEKENTNRDGSFDLYNADLLVREYFEYLLLHNVSPDDIEENVEKYRNRIDELYEEYISYNIDYIYDGLHLPIEDDFIEETNEGQFFNEEKFNEAMKTYEELRDERENDLSSQYELMSFVNELQSLVTQYKKDFNEKMAQKIEANVWYKLHKQAEIEKDDIKKHLQEFLDKTKDDWNYILPTDLQKKLDKYFILDVRKPDDFKKGHIKGAKNIFWMDVLKDNNLAKLPLDETIVIVCYVGHTASQVLVALKLLGYDVIVLKFGMGLSPVEGVPVAGWTDYNFPVIK